VTVGGGAAQSTLAWVWRERGRGDEGRRVGVIQQSQAEGGERGGGAENPKRQGKEAGRNSKIGGDW